MSGIPFANLDALATHLRQELENKKFILLYAYNGTGKTRLSMAFKNIGKQGEQGIRATSTPLPEADSRGITMGKAAARPW